MRIFFTLLLLLIGTVHAEGSEGVGMQISIKYVPPMRGAPASRIGGGNRGAGDVLPVLQVLAPDHTGLTILEQPVLYWFVSKPITSYYEVTLIDENEVSPLFEKMMGPPAKAGIHKLLLSEFGVKLKKEIEYRWYVSLIIDPNQRSKDIVSSGSIKRVNLSPELQKKLSGTGMDAKPGILAESGIWYDALSSISNLIEERPADVTLKAERADLLDEVGLGEAATSDRAPEK